jgi:hypothetical protein
MISCRYGVWKIVLWWLGVRVTTLGSMIVVFDSCWTSPCSDGTEESTMYRFGSVGKNTQKIHWSCMDIGSRGAMMLQGGFAEPSSAPTILSFYILFPIHPSHSPSLAIRMTF